MVYLGFGRQRGAGLWDRVEELRCSILVRFGCGLLVFSLFRGWEFSSQRRNAGALECFGGGHPRNGRPYFFAGGILNV